MWKASFDPEFSAQKDAPMEARLGNLTIVLTVLFGSGLLVSMGCRLASAILAVQRDRLLRLRVPTVALGTATYQLWEDEVELRVKFGWLCAAAGLVWAVALFCLTAEWVRIVSFRSEPITFIEGVSLFLGFAMPTLICGVTGITIVVERDK